MERLKVSKTFNNIDNAISTYCEKHYNGNEMEKLLLIHLAVEYAIENKQEFEFSDEYLSSLIKKMKIKISLSKYSIEEQMIKYNIIDMGNENSLLIELIDELIVIIENNNALMNILEKINHADLKKTIKLYLLNSHYDLEKLSENKKLKIVENVLLEYV